MAIELLTPFTKVELEPEIKEKKRKQVGILGGNFNPVHNAHLIVADQVRQQLGLDQVLLMPEYQPPHVDKKETIPEHHRLKMLELAIDGVEGLAIETIELERKGISYTYDTMKLLTEKNPDTDYYFIIGADMVDYLPKWYRIDELVDLVQFVGVQRPRYKAGTSYPVIWVDVPQRFGVDVEKAGLAGLLHDYAKKLSDQEFLDLIDRYRLDPDLKNWGNNVWHGMVGIYKLQEDLDLQDSEILRAIEIHTVGADQMTDLDKVIYVADYIEHNRVFPGVDVAREIAELSLNKAVAYETARTVEHLAHQGFPIYPQTLETYNAFVHYLKED